MILDDFFGPCPTVPCKLEKEPSLSGRGNGVGFRGKPRRRGRAQTDLSPQTGRQSRRIRCAERAIEDRMAGRCPAAKGMRRMRPRTQPEQDAPAKRPTCPVRLESRTFSWPRWRLKWGLRLDLGRPGCPHTTDNRCQHYHLGRHREPGAPCPPARKDLHNTARFGRIQRQCARATRCTGQGLFPEMQRRQGTQPPERLCTVSKTASCPLFSPYQVGILRTPPS